MVTPFVIHARALEEQMLLHCDCLFLFGCGAFSHGGERLEVVLNRTSCVGGGILHFVPSALFLLSKKKKKKSTVTWSVYFKVWCAWFCVIVLRLQLHLPVIMRERKSVCNENFLPRHGVLEYFWNGRRNWWYRCHWEMLSPVCIRNLFWKISSLAFSFFLSLAVSYSLFISLCVWD